MVFKARLITVSEDIDKYNENLPKYLYIKNDGTGSLITLKIEKGEDSFYYVIFNIES